MERWQDKSSLLITVLLITAAAYSSLFWIAKQINQKEKEFYVNQQNELMFKLNQEKKFFNQCQEKNNNHKNEKDFILSMVDCLKPWEQKQINSSVGILYLQIINKAILLEENKEQLKTLKTKVISQANLEVSKEAKNIYDMIEVNNFCQSWKNLGCFILKMPIEIKNAEEIKNGYIDFWQKQLNEVS